MLLCFMVMHIMFWHLKKNLSGWEEALSVCLGDSKMPSQQQIFGLQTN